jgi:hypothetical protein
LKNKNLAASYLAPIRFSCLKKYVAPAAAYGKVSKQGYSTVPELVVAENQL